MIISFVEITGDFICSLLLLVVNWLGLDGSFWPRFGGSFWPGLDGSFWPRFDGSVWPGLDGIFWPGLDGSLKSLGEITMWGSSLGLISFSTKNLSTLTSQRVTLMFLIISFVEIAGDFIISLLLLVDNWHGLDGSFWTGLDGSFWPPLGSF